MSSIAAVREPSPEMLADVQQIHAIRLISLPCELQSSYDVSMFVKQIIGMDAVSVNIVPMQTDSGVRYRSAFVDISKDSSLEYMQIIADQGLTIQGSDIPGGIHFDNGKPMSHMKVICAKPHSPSNDTLALEDGEWTSIYIPVIPSDLTMDNGDMRYNEYDVLVEFFEDQLKIGEVSRIDFMSKSVPGTDLEARCAYVHFDKWYDNQTSKLIRKTISAKGEFSCNGFYDGFEFRKFERNRFITFKVNHKPIPAATEDMNIHQLAAKVKQLEELNSQLEEKNSRIEEKNSRIEEKNALLEEKNSWLEEKNSRIEEKNSQLEEKNSRIEEKNSQIEEKNSRLEEQLVKPLTMEDAFKQLIKKMEEFKVVSNELMEKYGSNDAVDAAGVWELPEYKGYAFDYMGAISVLYDEFVPIIWR